MNDRFSKKSLIEQLASRMCDLERQYGFDPTNGWIQVRHKPIETAIAYGRYSAFQDLLDDVS